MLPSLLRPVELKVKLELAVTKRRAEFAGEVIIVRDANAVGVQQHVINAGIRMQPAEQFKELRMQRRLAAREVDRVDQLFLANQSFEHTDELTPCHVVIVPVLHDADRALQVAMIGDFDDRQAGVLLVIGTQSAVARTAVRGLRRKLVRPESRFRVSQRLQKPVRVTGDQRLLHAVPRTLLSQIDFAATNDPRAIHQLAADRTHPFAERMKDLALGGLRQRGEFRTEDREGQHYFASATSGRDCSMRFSIRRSAKRGSCWR